MTRALPVAGPPGGARRVALATVTLAFASTGCFGAPSYHWPTAKPVPAHWNGHRFHNVPDRKKTGVFPALRWEDGPPPIPWERSRDDVRLARPDERVAPGQMRITIVNHATTLVQLDGVNILTDPVWSDVVGPSPNIGVRRRQPAGVPFDALPHIDAVLISHSHYDHCDFPTLRRLAKRFRMPIFGGLGTTAMLDEAGIANGHDLDWWEHTSVALASRAGGQVDIVFAPADHSSRRGLFDGDQVLWGSFGVRGASGLVYFAGDTAYGPHFRAFRERIGAPDVALLPIGAYKPPGFMLQRHMGPAESLAAFEDLGARQAVAIHWGTFPLSDEGQFEPAGELGLQLDKAKIARARFVAPRNGEQVSVASAAAVAAEASAR